MRVVDVLDLPVEPLAERARDGGLARAHEADQIDLVGLHARELAVEIVEERGIGHGRGLGALDGDRAASRRARRSANAIARR